MAETNFTHLNKTNIINNAQNCKPATNKDGSELDNSWKINGITKKKKGETQFCAQSVGSNSNRSQKTSNATSPQSSCRQNDGVTNSDGITAVMNSYLKRGLQTHQNIFPCSNN